MSCFSFQRACYCQNISSWKNTKISSVYPPILKHFLRTLLLIYLPRVFHCLHFQPQHHKEQQHSASWHQSCRLHCTILSTIYLRLFNSFIRIANCHTGLEKLCLLYWRFAGPPPSLPFHSFMALWPCFASCCRNRLLQITSLTEAMWPSIE